MNVESMFRRLLYLQVMLGLSAFAMAERNPGFFLVAGAIALFSWYLVEGPEGRPLGRWLINLGGLAALAGMLLELQVLGVGILQAAGHLMTWLQVVLLFSRKRIQDYVLILVLSLMQMLCASLLSVSMFFGLLLMVYSLAAVWTAGAVALKVAADRAHRAAQLAAASDALPRPAAAGGVRMRRQFHVLTAAVALGVTSLAVLFFIFSPRYERFGVPDSWSRLVARPTIGFTDEVRLGGPPPSPDSQAAVMTVTFKQDEVPVGGGGSLWRLRGASLDEYDPFEHSWSRGRGVTGMDRALGPFGRWWLVQSPPKAAPVVAEIMLRAPPQGRLFVPYPPLFIESENLERIRFNPLDQEVKLLGQRHRPVNYRVLAPLSAASEPAPQFVGASPTTAPVSRGDRWDPQRYARGWPVEPERLRRLAEQIGAESAAESLEMPHRPQERLAVALTRYLRSQYTYTLAPPPSVAQQDPTLAFLFGHRQGHCETFASALAALARACGLRARVITGYLVSEFNAMGGYYVVRESDAHAWCEIECDGSWRTFDPSPPADVNQEHRSPDSWLRRARHFYEYLDFAWVRSVAAYDQHRRSALMADLVDQWVSLERGIGQKWAILHAAIGPSVWPRVLSYVGLALVAAGLALATSAMAGRFLANRRWRRRLDLRSLPRRQARQLAGELGFYLLMLRLLERRGYRRPFWQGPGDFARTLLRLQPLVMAPVGPLTELFYEVRFGGSAPDAERRRQARRLLRHLNLNLSSAANHGESSVATSREG